MASPSPSSSPRWDSAWDNRNSGFISPSQLQLWKQHQQQQQQQHQAAGSPPVPPQTSQGAPSQSSIFRTMSRHSAKAAQAAPPPPSTELQPTHSRTTSHFSFFSLKSRPQHNSQASTSSVGTAPHPSPPAGRPDEFGQQSKSSTSSTQPPLAGNGVKPTSPGNGPTSAPLSQAKPTADNTPLPPPPTSAPERSSTSGSLAPPTSTQPMHPEIRSILGLIIAQGRKIYFSGQLVHHSEREPDGTRSKDDGWHDVWAQLSGTTLSLWDMKEIEEANKQGRQVPPKYINIQDAFVAVLGSVTIPATANVPAKKYTNVLTLNTAGINLKLFACPSTQALLSWTAALRLAAWEKSRLEEIYTAHLFRITLQPDAARTPTPLIHGRMEGWVKARIAGRTDWRSLWMVISAGLAVPPQDSGSISSTERPTHPTKKNRLSALFSRDHSPAQSTSSKPTIQFFSSNKQKDMKKPVLTVREVTQAFAVYPEHPDLIEQSCLWKMEGLLGEEEVAGSFRNREGWLFLLPEPEGNRVPAVEMKMFLIGIHDVFGLYGRPRMYSWDPRDPRGMMFAYPIGEAKDHLFLDRELAENLDPRDDRTSANRAQLQHILWDRMRGTPESPASNRTSTAPRLPDLTLPGSQASPTSATFSNTQPLQLPAFQFEKSRTDYDLPEIPVQAAAPRVLTPITESSDPQHSRSFSGDPVAGPSTQHSPPQAQTQTSVNGRSPEQPSETGFLGKGLSSSPVETSPTIPGLPSDDDTRRHMSEDSLGVLSSSRPDSKLSHFADIQRRDSPPVIHQPFARTNALNAKGLSLSLEQELSSSQAGSSQAGSPRPFPTTRASAVSMSRDSSLPPPPHEDEEERDEPHPKSIRPGFELSDPPSPRFSILTSPHSVINSPVTNRASRQSFIHDHVPSPRESIHNMNASQPSSPIEPSARSPIRSPAPPAQPPMHSPTPPVTSPLHSPAAESFHSPRLVTSPTTHSKSSSRAESNDENDLLREAGALYYMRHIEQNHPTGPRRPPPPPDDVGDDSESEESSSYNPSPTATGTNYGATSPLRVNTSPYSGSPPMHHSSSPRSPPMTSSSYGSPQRGGTPVTFGQGSNKPVPAAPSPDKANAAISPRMASVPVRKPSGARAAPVSKTVAQRESHLQQPQRPPSSVDEASEEDMSDEHYSDEVPQGQRQLPPRMAAAEAEQEYQEHHADAVDALAALSYLEQEDVPPPPAPQNIPPPPPIPQVVEPRSTSPPASTETAPRSSFAPSKHASQRKAQAQAQQAASQATMHQPGKGRQKKAKDPAAWGDSSEEEEEEEEEDEDADSDAEPPQREGRSIDQRSLGPGSQAGYPPSTRGMSPGRPSDNSLYPQNRQRRDLPQVPQPSSMTPPGGSEESLGQQRRMPPDQYSEAGRRSMYPDASRRQASPQAPRSELPNPGAARQNVWSQVLDRQPNEPVRDTFVQLEPPSQTMTKAFAPHGLLSAGLQDKHDRSAKRQEELARETGSSLINVPNKPPPPQTGLLGAVTAHERERKREGGLGATLTEREREKRLAEDRQRKLDDFQRMQLEQMQQGGSIYGGMGMAPQFSGYNPMMNPMMMGGMNPMMTGGWGYGGMMNPQHMFAAQQAAQAYQQAMVAFSTAGSQVGPADGTPAAPLNPMMTGGGMMTGFDPRMSMMGMPMMGMNPSMTGMNPAMAGMNPAMAGMNPAMSMGQGMGGGLNAPGMGLGMQMTGGSTFDARYSPGNDVAMRAMSEANGSQAQLPYSSQNSSANGQGSPLGPRSQVQDPSDEQSKRVPDALR